MSLLYSRVLGWPGCEFDLEFGGWPSYEICLLLGMAWPSHEIALVRVLAWPSHEITLGFGLAQS